MCIRDRCRLEQECLQRVRPRSSLSRCTEMKSIKSLKRIGSEKPDGGGGGGRQAHRKEDTPTLVVSVSSKRCAFFITFLTQNPRVVMVFEDTPTTKVGVSSLRWACRPPPPPPPSGFSDPMRLGDFIDFISVQREREDRGRTRCEHSCSRRHTVYYEARCLLTSGGRNRINLRIGGSANPQINKC